MHPAGKLQAQCRPSGNNTTAREKFETFFSKVHYFFSLEQHQKQNMILLAHWENFKIGGVKRWKKNIHVNKIVFLCNYLGKMKLGVEKNVIFFCYTSYLKVLAMSFQEEVFFVLA